MNRHHEFIHPLTLFIHDIKRVNGVGAVVGWTAVLWVWLVVLVVVFWTAVLEVQEEEVISRSAVSDKSIASIVRRKLVTSYREGNTLCNQNSFHTEDPAQCNLK